MRWYFWCQCSEFSFLVLKKNNTIYTYHSASYFFSFISFYYFELKKSHLTVIVIINSAIIDLATTRETFVRILLGTTSRFWSTVETKRDHGPIFLPFVLFRIWLLWLLGWAGSAPNYVANLDVGLHYGALLLIEPPKLEIFWW